MKSFKQYITELSKSTLDKRAAHFNKQSDMSDDSPSAYKSAPGDAKAKTKTSKWTKAYADKYGQDEEYIIGYKSKHEDVTKKENLQ